MTLRRSLSAIAWAAAFFCAQTAIAQSAEIKVVSAEALRSVFDELARDFERQSGHKVVA
jgi:ABC-type molybdate transport system substrate-binding protein